MSDIKTIQEDIRHEVGIDLICGLLGKLTNILINIKNSDIEDKEQKIEKLRKIKAALAKERDEAYRGNKDTIERAYTIYVTLLDLIAVNESSFIEIL
ncbi:hypothetical protein [Caldicellulosiruptor morganii]|uniref:Uncharacterized protein n=1 Tax=Caldicellulosiruptor morganii TaxID=1387555 RepID=A0ABY7BPC6_9FIRM|nr:hypothetical protein [Caldicellulosiruptor morganii]WAM34385.1 hypothetical protein OTK00_000581 [Caldicellulosiruptor morganii]